MYTLSRVGANRQSYWCDKTLTSFQEPNKSTTKNASKFKKTSSMELTSIMKILSITMMIAKRCRLTTILSQKHWLNKTIMGTLFPVLIISSLLSTLIKLLISGCSYESHHIDLIFSFSFVICKDYNCLTDFIFVSISQGLE